MWSSSGKNNGHGNGAFSSSPSKSSTSCSSPSPPGTPNKKSMEEVWNDLNLTSLQGHSNATVPNTTSSPRYPSGLIFQDFFATAFNKDPKAKDAASREPTPLRDITPFGSHHGTMLSLNSGSEFQNLERDSPNHTIRTRPPSQQLHVHPNIAAACPFGSSLHNSPFDALGSPPPFQLGSPLPLPLKRPQENEDLSDDRRHKRLIKNRESAARSRARKQESFSPFFLLLNSAYTTELELEVSQLMEENAKLRKQQKQLLAASTQIPKKHSLHRTLTAPF
ncbi:ABSCISIC ACID-INSENSITIVE 5-like protein 5 [Melia azedarach]|uniref:ABSCISIC ACID-INSENSITIVE 5-like protein 5 n=1 Tax=Melia azedarach TaxID=155640 RepID=A0ACC1WSK3_MELAZ|nr:ABSCISIC ACID-INSENSITIVE 5-like protein 5 [Melia azedarach]